MPPELAQKPGREAHENACGPEEKGTCPRSRSSEGAEWDSDVRPPRPVFSPMPLCSKLPGRRGIYFSSQQARLAGLGWPFWLLRAIRNKHLLPTNKYKYIHMYMHTCVCVYQAPGPGATTLQRMVRLPPAPSGASSPVSTPQAPSCLSCEDGALETRGQARSP